MPLRFVPQQQSQPGTKTGFMDVACLVNGHSSIFAGGAVRCIASTAQQIRQHVDDMSLVSTAATCGACVAKLRDRFVILVAGLWTAASIFSEDSL